LKPAAYGLILSDMASGSDSAIDDPLDAAAERLDVALGAVEARMRALSAQLDQARSGAAQNADSDADRARLAEALDSARAREAELESAVQEASEALGEAIGALRAQRDLAVEIAEAAEAEPVQTDSAEDVQPDPVEGESASGRAPERGAQGRYSLFDWEDGDDEPDDESANEDDDAGRGGAG